MSKYKWVIFGHPKTTIAICYIGQIANPIPSWTNHAGTGWSDCASLYDVRVRWLFVECVCSNKSRKAITTETNIHTHKGIYAWTYTHKITWTKRHHKITLRFIIVLLISASDVCVQFCVWVFIYFHTHTHARPKNMHTSVRNMCIGENSWNNEYLFT